MMPNIQVSKHYHVLGFLYLLKSHMPDEQLILFQRSIILVTIFKDTASVIWNFLIYLLSFLRYHVNLNCIVPLLLQVKHLRYSIAQKDLFEWEPLPTVFLTILANLQIFFGIAFQYYLLGIAFYRHSLFSAQCSHSGVVQSICNISILIPKANVNSNSNYFIYILSQNLIFCYFILY